MLTLLGICIFSFSCSKEEPDIRDRITGEYAGQVHWIYKNTSLPPEKQIDSIYQTTVSVSKDTNFDRLFINTPRSSQKYFNFYYDSIPPSGIYRFRISFSGQGDQVECEFDEGAETLSISHRDYNGIGSAYNLIEVEFEGNKID